MNAHNLYNSRKHRSCWQMYTFYDHGGFDWNGHRVKVFYNHECVFLVTGLWVNLDAPYFVVSFIRLFVVINEFSIDFFKLNVIK